MTVEIGVGLAMAGVIFGWGASWATLGQKITSLKETTEKSFESNDEAHVTLLKKLESMSPLSVRVAVLEMKVFGQVKSEPTKEG